MSFKKGDTVYFIPKRHVTELPNVVEGTVLFVVKDNGQLLVSFDDGELDLLYPDACSKDRGRVLLANAEWAVKHHTDCMQSLQRQKEGVLREIKLRAKRLREAEGRLEALRAQVGQSDA